MSRWGFAPQPECRTCVWFEEGVLGRACLAGDVADVTPGPDGAWRCDSRAPRRRGGGGEDQGMETEE